VGCRLNQQRPEMKMNPLKTLIATAAAAAALMSMNAPAVAGEATPWPELMMKAADVNKDGMVTRQEFLDHMAKVWDDKHAKMMKTDTTMKAGMMDKAQFMTFVRVMFVDPGKIGG
jgi:Ca2+-binding EF-hand superfamily protein